MGMYFNMVFGCGCEDSTWETNELSECINHYTSTSSADCSWLDSYGMPVSCTSSYSYTLKEGYCCDSNADCDMDTEEYICDANGDGIKNRCNNIDTNGNGINDGCCTLPERISSVYTVENDICNVYSPFAQKCTDCYALSYVGHIGCAPGEYCCGDKQCYNREGQICCGTVCGNPTPILKKYSPQKEEVYAECCDANGVGGDGNEEVCTGETPYCESLYEVNPGGWTVLGGYCLITPTTKCAECEDNNDCIRLRGPWSSCCNGECIDERTQVCCSPPSEYFECEKVESRSDYCVSNGGTCYKPGANTKCEDLGPIPTGWESTDYSDSYKMIIGNVGPIIEAEARAECNSGSGVVGLDTDIGFSSRGRGGGGLPGLPGFFFDTFPLSGGTCTVIKNPQSLFAVFGWGDNTLQGSIAAWTAMEWRYESYPVQTGYEKVDGEVRGRGRGRGSEKSKWGPTFGTEEVSYIEYFGGGGVGFTSPLKWSGWSVSVHGLFNSKFSEAGYSAILQYQQSHSNAFYFQLAQFPGMSAGINFGWIHRF